MAARTRARPRRTKAETPTTAADIDVKVDADLKRRWDAMHKVIASAQSRGASAWDELYEAAAKIIDGDPPLYVVGGYENAAEFCREVLKESERTARRNMRVARYASPREEAKYGVHLLDAALGYIEAKAGKPIDGSLPVDFARLKVPVAREGQTRSVLLADATIPEVTAATKKLLQAKGKSRAKESVIARAVVTTLKKVKSLAGIEVHERDGMLTFLRVPAASLAAFARAAASAKWSEASAAARGRNRPSTRPK